MSKFEQEWDDMILLVSKHFGVLANYEFILFITGIQEKGGGFADFSKQEKMDLINLAKCRMLEREGHLQEVESEDEWAQFIPRLSYLSLSDSEKETIIKHQILKYVKENLSYIN